MWHVATKLSKHLHTENDSWRLLGMCCFCLHSNIRVSILGEMLLNLCSLLNVYNKYECVVQINTLIVVEIQETELPHKNTHKKEVNLACWLWVIIKLVLVLLFMWRCLHLKGPTSPRSGRIFLRFFMHLALAFWSSISKSKNKNNYGTSHGNEEQISMTFTTLKWSLGAYRTRNKDTFTTLALITLFY